MIDRKLIIANAPERVGDEVHINHVGCSAGDDHKKRLYIKRTHKNIVAYCHHCTESRAIYEEGSRLGRWLKPKASSPTTGLRAPDLDELSIEGKSWLARYDCNLLSKNFKGVKKHPNKVALALKNPSGEQIGIQVRNLTPGETKYITYFYHQEHKSEGSWFYKPVGTGATDLVITEDYLSAHRIYEDAKCSSLALLRTSLTSITLQQIHALKFKSIYIWLDPDQAGVHGASEVQKKLHYYLPQETLIEVLHIPREPKQYTREELCGFLNNPFV